MGGYCLVVSIIFRDGREEDCLRRGESIVVDSLRLAW
jgi:hypothetical protein